MQSLIINIKITKDEYLRFYQGQAKQVRATSEDGRNVIFPANTLRQFITHDGIHGRFEFNYDQAGKLQNVTKL